MLPKLRAVGQLPARNSSLWECTLLFAGSQEETSAVMMAAGDLQIPMGQLRAELGAEQTGSNP